MQIAILPRLARRGNTRRHPACFRLRHAYKVPRTNDAAFHVCLLICSLQVAPTVRLPAGAAAAAAVALAAVAVWLPPMATVPKQRLVGEKRF